MNRHPPKLSIITPSYNSEEYIEEAIESVRSQNYSNYEHIIVDGGSTDNTLEILKDYNDLVIISEEDDGIYDAMNKGLRKASGELIGWLNSDDVYAKNAFNTLVAKFLENTDSDLIAGSSDIFTNNSSNRISLKKYDFTHPMAFKRGEIRHNETLLNGCLLTKDLVKQIGEFDKSLEIAGDKDYLVRIAASQPEISRTTKVVYRYRQHEGSLTFNESYTFDDFEETRLSEGMEFMLEYARDDSLPKSLRNYCLANYRDRSSTLFKKYMYNGQYLAVLSLFIYSTKRDFFWPIIIASKSINKFVLKPIFRQEY